MANWIDRKFPAIFPLACLLILVACHFVFAAGSRQIHKTETVTVWVNDSGDTAVSLIFVPTENNDTVYKDTFILGNGVTDSVFWHSNAGTTVKRVCDSMAAKVNANAVLNPYLLAVSEDTLWRVTSKKKGLAVTPIKRDALHTCDTIQANVQGKTIQYDTLDLIQLITDQRRVGGIYGDIIIKPSEDTGKGGLGNSDSAYLYFGVRRIFDTGTSYTFIYKDSANALPCTLHFALPYAAANDTILKPIACLMWGVSDTCSDTNYAAEYDISIDILVLDQ